MLKPTTYVVFLDILGFAAAVESLSSEDDQDLETAAILGRAPSRFAARAVHALYSDFQNLVEESFGEYGRAHSLLPSGTMLSAALFSDSVFIATSELVVALRLTWSLSLRALLAGVPIRGGLAAGAFHAFPAGTTAYAGGPSILKAPFLGSAVVRAYFAESRGGKGLRVFIHRSAIPYVAELMPSLIVELPIEELAWEGARHELNLLYGGAHQDGSNWQQTLGRLAPAVEKMRLASPEQFRHHYTSTASALRRMSVICSGAAEKG